MLTIRLETSPPTNSISSFVDNPYVAVVGGTYRGSAGILVKETDCRYKIRLSTGREVYLKKTNVKVQLDGDSGDVAKQLLKIQYHIDCLMDFFKQLDVTRLA